MIDSSESMFTSFRSESEKISGALTELEKKALWNVLRLNSEYARYMP